MCFARLIFLFLISSSLFGIDAQDDPPNILLIIADDLGVDRLNGYHTGDQLAHTPTLDSLRSAGITFENVFAAPKCTPSRAAIMSGKFGVNTGVLGTPGTLDLTHTSIFKELATRSGNAYADALIGKWHLTSPLSAQAPIEHGADYYMGFLGAFPEDYYAWSRTENGTTNQSNDYVTSAFTDASIEWIGQQTQPWFLWLAHAAPHAPYHVPPAGTYSVTNTQNNVGKYIAMVEAMDFGIRRLLSSLNAEQRENTLLIFLGDNGTPGNVMQDYPTGHGKSTLYQGGVRVPLIISGKGVERIGQRESALVHLADLYATILEASGTELPGGIFNSLSFYPLFSEAQSVQSRDYNYTEIESGSDSGWAIREARYKLIRFDNGGQEMYDLQMDSLELINLLTTPLSDELLALKTDLEAEALAIRTGWSCRDYIQNGDETGTDCGTSTCGSCTSSVDAFDEDVPISVYPNPNRDYFRVETRGEVIQRIDVFDESGRLLLRSKGNGSDKLMIETNHLSARVLHILVKTAQGQGSAKLIRE